jgi:HPr kinase/phosphorylase
MQFAEKDVARNISIAHLVENFPAKVSIEVLAGKDNLQNCFVTSTRIQKLGLALAGFTNYIQTGRIQIVGQSEILFLRQLESRQRIEAINNLDLEKICCILITKNLSPPKELIDIAEQNGVPVLRTFELSSNAINIVSTFLQKALAPQIVLHGVLLGMYGLGVLILGESGIGKSECALDLITRGHRLVSDDSVLVRKIGDNLEGSAPELTREHLEIRGLGIINVRELFGVTAVGQCQNIELLIELKKRQESKEIDRLGIDKQEADLFGSKITKFVLPISAGRNVSSLIETAVRLHLLRANGFNAAQTLIERHSAIIQSN